MTLDGLRAAVLIGVAAICFGSGWQVRDWQADSDDLKALQRKTESEALARGLIAGVAKQTLEAIGEIRITNRTIYQKTRHEITRDPVYINCRVPAAGGVLVNAARAGELRPGADAEVRGDPAGGDQP